MSTFDKIRVLVLAIATLGLFLVSRRALLNFRSHGFARFFAWETIILLVLLNCPYWFVNPLSARQVLAWTILCASLFVLWRGVKLLKTAKPTQDRAETELYEFEKTSALVTSDIYRYIRHPLYASLLYLACGAFLKDISWSSGVLFVVAIISLVATSVADEHECIKHFGSEYTEYMTTTKRFIPYLL